MKLYWKNPNKGQMQWNKILKNQKHLPASPAQPATKQPATEEIVTEQPTSERTVAERPAPGEIVVEQPASEIVAEQPVPEIHSRPGESSPREKTLPELIKEEAALRSKVMRMESSRKELLAESNQLRKELRNLQSDIGKFATQLEECRNRYNDISNRADGIAQRIAALSHLRKEQAAALEVVRQRIKEASKVFILVNKDGVIEIEAPSTPNLHLDDSGYLETKDALFLNEEFQEIIQNLTVRDITTLARLLRICESIEYYELVCDSPELEKAFRAIHPEAD